MRITSKAPCRVDLAGATLDIWPLYLFHSSPVTVNFAVDRYTSCVLETRDDTVIELRSIDLKMKESFASLAALRAAGKYKLRLLALLVDFFAPAQGITLVSDSEAPAGAGISGSSALMITVAVALNKLTGAGHKLEKLREIVQNIEAQVIRVPTGAQDYFPAMYGGVSAIELTPAGVVRHCMPVPAEELDSRFVLAYTGEPRNSGINNWEVMKAHIDGDRQVHRNFDRIASIARAMRIALEGSNWEEAWRLMREDWISRRKNIPTISTPLIDELVKVSRRVGSTGAKVCGAGGGGCVVFLVEPGAKQKVAQAVAAAGAQVLNAKVAPLGVQVGGDAGRGIVVQVGGDADRGIVVQVGGDADRGIVVQVGGDVGRGTGVTVGGDAGREIKVH
ncbi:MAG TPA: hypothetical protein VNH18_28310 [Bryobacteraceae bacterium]|nr:hypothetical protein [Bryobacteraceae bacterium]